MGGWFLKGIAAVARALRGEGKISREAIELIETQAERLDAAYERIASIENDYDNLRHSVQKEMEAQHASHRRQVQSLSNDHQACEKSLRAEIGARNKLELKVIAMQREIDVLKTKLPAV